MIANQMGPNVLWLTEFLSQAMDLQPGMRVLDLGCGKALSSIFLEDAAPRADLVLFTSIRVLRAADSPEHD